METISLNISLNDNCAEDYQKIMIRKFFNMIFIGKDGMSLHIYTATIISGGIDNNSSSEDFYPSYEKNRINLRFWYDGAKDIRFTNISDSIFHQKKCLSKVWGNCMELSGADNVSDAIRALYARNENDHGLPPDIQALLIHDNDKTPLQSCVAVEGEYHSWEADGYYCLSSQYQCSGIEYLNWIKTEVRLNHSIINDRIKFSIKFDFPAHIKCFCPDYTWYICTPTELSNNPASAYVRFDDRFVHSNMMQSLAKETLLPFNEWVYDEGITGCNRCRLRFEGQKSSGLSKKSYISIEMFVEEFVEKHGNRQFFTGLVIAFMLAYFSDWTRINEIYKLSFATVKYSKIVYIFDIVFPLNVLLSYIAIIIPLDKVLYGMKKRFEIILVKWSKKCGLFFSFICLFGFYVLFPVLKMLNCDIGDTGKRYVIFISAFLGIVGTVFYIVFSCLKRKISLYNYL